MRLLEGSLFLVGLSAAFFVIFSAVRSLIGRYVVITVLSASQTSGRIGF